MPVTPTYPGVYVEEIPSGVRTITGVSTSTTAFVGKAQKGPVNRPTQVHSFGEYTRLFGVPGNDYPMSFSVMQYFLNGGKAAVIVRVVRGGGGSLSATARFTLPGAGGGLVLDAANPGSWANNLTITADHNVRPEPDDLFNLTISDPAPDGTGVTEVLRNLPPDATQLAARLEKESSFVRLNTAHRPDDGATETRTVDGADGGVVRDEDIVDAGGTDGKRGMYALEDADIFNLLVLPPRGPGQEVAVDTWAAAAVYCRSRRAFLLIDPPPGGIAPPADAGKTGFTALTGALSPGSLDAQYAAYFFPRFRATNPLTRTTQEFAPAGAIAGVFARTDAQRGVWKAPAGLEAGLTGITELSYPLTDGENGTLNQVGINCLRSFPLMGSVIWGSRTVQGSDALGSEWKYVPIRRLALFIEESLFRGTKWAVFEPNDEPLWAQIRLNVGGFMNRLFRQGAFAGLTPKDAYFVKCDAETTTQADRNLGIVNVLVGFAPLKPAEFVILQIQQIAGDIET